MSCSSPLVGWMLGKVFFLCFYTTSLVASQTSSLTCISFRVLTPLRYLFQLWIVILHSQLKPFFATKKVTGQFVKLDSEAAAGENALKHAVRVAITVQITRCVAKSAVVADFTVDMLIEAYKLHLPAGQLKVVYFVFIFLFFS
jgi:hypothetical protein